MSVLVEIKTYSAPLYNTPHYYTEFDILASNMFTMELKFTKDL